jgi:AraC-like DNA-binding protein/ligand-binding sensor protein
MQSENGVIEAIQGSELYKEYERAFNEATGLPLALRPVESWQLPHHRQRKENPFCAMLAERSKACAACLQVQQSLAERAVDKAASVTCPAGLCDTAVPVRMGNQLLGFLHTGQIFRSKPSAAQFDKLAQLFAQWGLQGETEKLKAAYLGSRVMNAKEHESVVKLLTIFAEHLSMVSNQILVQKENAEPPMITRAKQFIRDHFAEELSLGQVAKAVNTSTFYFCKMFKKFTGINFTEYLSRIRIESARNLLLNPNLRVSEIAYEVGFQSLTHFNRVFKKVVGQSPTEFRSHLAHV